jgi:hypothetical protein
MGAEWLIRFLFGIIGLLGGVGIMHFWILRRVNKNTVDIAMQGRDLKTAFSGLEQHDKRLETALILHRTTLDSINTLISQNNLLIQKIIAEHR